MADENIGLRCPKCGSDEGARVSVPYGVNVRKKSITGSRDTRTHCNYDDGCCDSDECMCLEGLCGHKATVADFRSKSVPQMLLEVAEKIIIDIKGFEYKGGRFESVYLAAEAAIKAAKDRGLDG